MKRRTKHTPLLFRRAWPVVLIASASILGASCTDDFATADVSPTAAISPIDRAVHLTTTGCGHANDAIGLGVLISSTEVVTVAHAVAGAERISVGIDDAITTATIAHLDPDSDLALLVLDRPIADHIKSHPVTAGIGSGRSGTIVRPFPDPGQAFVVDKVTQIEMDRVRSQGRATRYGFTLRSPAINRGDSGAGLYDLDGALIGLLFAASTDESRRGWAVGATEIDRFLQLAASQPGPPGPFGCDPDRSAAVPVGG